MTNVYGIDPRITQQIADKVLALDMNADYSARQIVDDLFKVGIDVRMHQGVIEGILLSCLK